MCGLYFSNKWKSQRFGKIINKMSKILNSQRLSRIPDIHKVGSQITIQNNWRIIQRYGIFKD